jgi:hypothetical protein
VKFSPQDITREKAAHEDGFDLMLRRQGWYLIRYKPIHTDPKVIRVHWQVTPDGAEYGENAFYEAFGENTFRKLLRHIFFHRQCMYEELKRICGSEQKLEKHLTFMKDQELVVQDEQDKQVWRKGPAYKHIENLGPTLEWYVAEWFRSWLQVPARHGVAIKDVADGGDLDVVAFVDGIRIMVECKSGSPTKITDTEINLFLQRAADFNPEIAVLLIDTESVLDQQVEMINRLRKGGDPISQQDKHHSLYWGARHIYVCNARVSIAESMSAVLRLYYSRIRHIAFWR